jgi:uncharacterized protein
MNILIFGGTGFIGKALTGRLSELNHKITLVSRNPEKYRNFSGKNISVIGEKKNNAELFNEAIEKTDAIINLAGEPISNKRWTSQQKEKIITSRINTTADIINSIRNAKNKPEILVNISAVGFYGNTEEMVIDEASPKGSGFLAKVCELWENEAKMAENFGVRVIIPRLGIVLEKNGGALKKLLFPFKFYMGGPLGSGKQWFPWIHLDDVVNSIIFSLENNISGVFNAVSPNPVRMKEFCSALGKIMRKPSWLYVPSFILKILLGEMSQMLLTGQKAYPKKLIESGYKFKYERVEDALKGMFKSANSQI